MMPGRMMSEPDTRDTASYDSVSAAIAAGIEAGRLQPDEGQAAVGRALDDLLPGLATAGGRGWFRRRAAAPRGLYIHGGVGRGKTMLMDMFHDALLATTPKAPPFPRLVGAPSTPFPCLLGAPWKEGAALPSAPSAP